MVFGVHSGDLIRATTELIEFTARANKTSIGNAAKQLPLSWSTSNQVDTETRVSVPRGRH